MTDIARDALRVLVVEDNEDLAAVYAEFLTKLGYEAAYAATATQALRVLEREPPDAILLDLRLRGMSGLDFLRSDTVRQAGLPIVAISGVASAAESQEALKLGAMDILIKPVTLERLSSLLSFLEAHALKGPKDGRRVARAKVEFPIRVGAVWDWHAVDLSPFGVKVASQGWLRPGATVRLLLTLPDGQPPLGVDATFVRGDPDGDLFSFLNLAPGQFRRLERFLKPRGQPG